MPSETNRRRPTLLDLLSPWRLTEQAQIRLAEHGRLRVFASSKWRQVATFVRVMSLILLWTLLNVCLGVLLFNLWHSMFVLLIPIFVHLSGLTSVILQGTR